MLSLTFGEQVKIVLSRKGMTIKELAEQIEERTGKRMSRQNLTQRLGRDNFQEQDMRMIAEILGCSFQLSILATQEAQERASVIEETPPTAGELGRLEAARARRLARAQKKEIEESSEESERDMTIGELVELMEAPVEGEETVGPEPAEQPQQEASEETEAAAPTEQEAGSGPEPEEDTGSDFLSRIEIVKIEDAEQTKSEEEKKAEKKAAAPSRPVVDNRSRDFQPIRRRADLDEDREKGDVNPYTGREYQSNSVRMHPRRIGYVQVYDRKDHKWTDMTEWAFLGVEERKKAAQGKDYEPPIYLD